MKRSNKILSFGLALALIFQSLTVSFADTEMTTNEKAQVLYELGLFDGVSSIGFVPYLDGDANREQAMKMIAVALNWSIDESATSNFSDVSDWAEPYVTKAVITGVTNGVGNDSEGNPIFGASDDITARQLQTWFDRVINGSTTAWDDNANLDNQQGISRGDLVDATYEALMQTPIGASESLIETIVGTDLLQLEIATSAGLIEVLEESIDEEVLEEQSAENQAPTVEEIEAASTIKIVVTFSKDLEEESAVDIDNYELYDDDGEKVDDIIKDVDIEDDDVITIKFEESLAGNYTLIIDGVEDEDGNDMDNYEVSFELDDGEGPEIDEIEVEDLDEIVITFTKALDEDSAEDDDYYILYDDDDEEVEDIFDTIKLTDEDEVTIKFEEDLSGEYTLDIDGVEDLFGNDTEDKEEFEIEGNLTIDSAVLISTTEIEVTFNDKLDGIDEADFIVYADEDGSKDYDEDEDEVLDIDNYYIDNDDGEVVLTIVLEDEVSTGGYTLKRDGDISDDLIRITTTDSDTGTISEHGATLSEDDDHEIEDEVIPELVGYYAVDEDENDQIDRIVAEYTEEIDNDFLANASYDVDDYSIADVYTDDDLPYLVIIEIVESGEEDLDEEPEVSQDRTIYDLSGNKLSKQDEEEAMSADDKDNSYM